MMVLGMSTVCFSKSLLAFNDWNMEMNLPKLVRYLDVNSSQYDDVANAMDYFSDKMPKAKYLKMERQIKCIKEAVYGNLKLIKSTLTQSQYKKYLVLMNAQLHNKGLDSYLKNVSDL